MSRKIQFHTFNLLFRLFSYLADRSGGWSMFVRPKLMIGGVIVGLGVTGCNTKPENNPLKSSDNQTPKTSNKISEITHRMTSVKDCTKKSNELNYKKTLTEPVISCYDIELPDDDQIDTSKTRVKVGTNQIYSLVDSIPEFPRGENALIQYIDSNFVYPKQLFEQNVKGRIICRFIVNTDGTISDIKVVIGAHPLLDTEAIRVIKNFPKWNPGKINGKAVRSYYTIPVRF